MKKLIIILLLVLTPYLVHADPIGGGGIQGISQTQINEFLKSSDSVLHSVTNPKAMSQAVNMTAAASGSTGITVADNANIDFGTGNFTLVWRGSLPNWTSASAHTILLEKSAATGWTFRNLLDGRIYMYFDGDNVAKTATITPTFIADTEHEIAAVITRGVSVVYYVDGTQLGNAVAYVEAGDISNAAALFVLGNASVRSAGTTSFAATFNRALTAVEVLDLYRNGIAFADKWGSQTEVMPNQVDRDFSGASAWANVDINAYNETTDLTITASAAAQYCTLVAASAPMVYGKKYRLTFDVANLVSTWTIKDFAGTITIGTVSVTGAQSMEFENTGAAVTGGFRIIAVGTTSSGDFDNFSLKEIGATLALESEGIQPNPGQWLDSSSNKLHAWQPAVGSSLARYKNTFEIRGINTWAGANAPQSIAWATDASKAILPVGCYIESIIGVITGGTIEDIRIGDGSATERWVANTTGLATGTVAFTIANKISDGTNYEMVVDPDANFTGSIEWTIKGIILE